MPLRLLAVGLAALASVGCSGSDTAGAPPRATDDASSIPASSEGSSTPTTSPPPPESSDDALADGRHAGYLQHVDAAARTVAVDVIQFLTGDAARDASMADGRGHEVRNDHYIRNVNPRIRTLALADAVEVTVLDSSLGGTDAARSVPADVVTLARVVQLRAGAGGSHPFWVTVAGGRVAKVEEQYLP